MISNECEIKNAFPEFIHHNEDDLFNEYLEEKVRLFNELIIRYKEEKGILCQIENKLCSVLNQTPNSEIIRVYQQLQQNNFSEQKLLRVSKIHDFNDLPKLTQVNYFYENKANDHENQNQFITWPYIGHFKKEQEEELIRIYNFQSGRIALHEILLLWFPCLLPHYLNILENIFTPQSPLRLDYQYYIAITGVSTYGCEQLYQLLIQQYRQADGDDQWLDCGYEALPQKLQKLDLVFKYLSQKPWELELKNQISLLLKSGWQLQEMVHALLIYIFYNSLACFSLGNGICKEIDLSSNDESQNTSFISHRTPPRKFSDENIDFNNQVVQYLKDFEQNSSTKQQQQQQIIQKYQEIQQSQDIQQENIVINQQQQQQDEFDNETQNQQQIFKEKFLKYFDSQQVAQEQPLYQVLRSSEYSFSLNAYPVLRDIFKNVANPIHGFIKEIKSMTRKSFGQENQIETGAFRKAIRVYGENIYRYQHDDVDYSAQMNKIMPRELKLFIKLVSQTPNLVCKQHVENIPLKLSADELCHITLLTVAAKIETQMIYLSRSLIENM